MASNNKGKITVTKSIDNKVFDIGSKYAESIKPALKVNKEWLDSFEPIKKAFNERVKLEKQFHKASGRKEFLAAKKKQTHAIEQTTVALKLQQTTEKNLIATIEKKTLATEGTNKALVKERLELHRLNKLEKEEAVLKSKTSSLIDKLIVKRSRETRVMQDLIAKKELGIKLSKKEQRTLQRSTREFNKYENAIKKAKIVTKQFQENVGNYPTKLKAATSALRNLVGAFGLVSGVALFTKIMRGAFVSVRQFGKEIANLRAITKTNAVELEALAKTLGEKTVFSANEAAKAMTLLAQAGFNTNQILTATPKVLDLAAAGNVSLAEAADIASNVLSGFGLKAEETGRVVDILASTATSTNTTILTLGESFKEIAPTAANLGIPIEEVAGAVGLLGNSGIKGTDATTALNTALNRLAKPTKEMKSKMKELNVEFFNSKGQFIGITKTIKLLNKRFVGLTDKQKAAAVSAIFGARANKQMTSLINGQTTAIINNEEVVLKGAEAIAHLTKEYENSGGAAKEMADTQLQSLDGAIRLLQSAWEGLILKMNDSSGAGKELTKVIGYLAENLQTIATVIGVLTGIWFAYKAVVIASNSITKLHTASTIAMRIAKVALSGGITGVTRAFKLFSAAVKVSPLGIFLLTLGGAIFLFNKYNKSLSETVGETKKSTEEFLKNKKASENNSAELLKLTTRYKELKSKTKLSKEEQIELNKIINMIAKNVPSAVTEIDKYGNAIEISTDKTEAFIKRQKEIASLETSIQIRKEKKALEELENKMKSYNLVAEGGNKVRIDGIGLIEKQGEAYFKINSDFSSSGNLRITETKLTKEQTLAYKKQFLNLEALTNATKQRIADLDGTTEALNKQKAAEDELAKNDRVKVLVNEITQLDNKADRNKLLLQSEEDLIDILDSLKVKTKELSEEEEKATEKSRKLRIEREKSANSASHKLKVAELNGEINTLKDVANDEEETLKDRVKAQVSFNDKKIELLKLNRDNELKLLEKQQAEEEAIGGKSVLVTQKYIDLKKTLDLKYQADRSQIAFDGEAIYNSILKDGFDKAKKSIADKQKAIEDSLSEGILALQGQLQRKEISVTEYEQKVLDLKKSKAREALEIEIEAIDSEIETRKLRGEDVVKLEEQLSNARKALSNLDTDNIIANEHKIADLKKQLIDDSTKYLADALGLSSDKLSDFKDALVNSFKEGGDKIEETFATIQAGISVVGDVANAIYEGNIDNLEGQIQASEEYYAREYELAGDDQVKKDLLKKKEERDRKVLNNKIAKEKTKAAKAEKAAMIIQAGMSTALAAIKSLATTPLPAGAAMLALTLGLGAVQIAAIAAKPIPKYAKGTEWHPGGHALVGEVRPEVISEPGKDPYIVDEPTILNLSKGTKVTPSVAEYENLMRVSILSSLDIDNQKAKEYQSKTSSFDQRLLLLEMKLTREAIERQQTNVNIQAPNIDLEFLAYRNEQLDN